MPDAPFFSIQTKQPSWQACCQAHLGRQLAVQVLHSPLLQHRLGHIHLDLLAHAGKRLPVGGAGRDWFNNRAGLLPSLLQSAAGVSIRTWCTDTGACVCPEFTPGPAPVVPNRGSKSAAMQAALVAPVGGTGYAQHAPAAPSRAPP